MHRARFPARRLTGRLVGFSSTAAAAAAAASCRRAALTHVPRRNTHKRINPKPLKKEEEEKEETPQKKICGGKSSGGSVIIQCVKRLMVPCFLFVEIVTSFKEVASFCLCVCVFGSWSLVQHASFLPSLSSLTSPRGELCVCLQPRPPAAGYIRPDTCYGNNMQMHPPPPRPNFTSQSGPALHNGTPPPTPPPPPAAAAALISEEPTCESISVQLGRSETFF